MQDQLFRPAGNDDPAINEISHVAGVHVPAGPHDRSRGLLVAEIACHEAWTFDEQPTNLPVAQRPSHLVHYDDFVPGQRFAANHEGPDEFGIAPRLEVRWNGPAVVFERQPVDDIHFRRTIDFRKGYSKRRFGHSITREERRRIEFRRLHSLGEFVQHVRAHHIPADAGDPQRRKIEVCRLAVEPAARKLITERRRVGDRRPVVGHQSEPQCRPAGESLGRQIVGADLPHHRRDAKADEAHVVVQRQPGKGAVARRDL